MLSEMMRNGVLVDRAHFAALDEQLAIKQAELEWKIENQISGNWLEFTRTTAGAKWAGKRFEPGSPDQVAALLFGALELEVQGKPQRTKSGRISTDDDILSAIKNQHPIVSLELDYREVTKLRTTYTGPLPTMIDPDGRLRTVFKPNVTTTGRLSSGDRKKGKPNLQNIPIRSQLLVTLPGWDKPQPVGVAIRNGFIAGPGNYLVSGDLSQIEMRMACHLANCGAMRLVFVLGKDIHTQTAIALFKLVPEEVLGLLAAEKAGILTPTQASALKEFKLKYRLPAKNLGFGVLYGQTALGLQAKIMAEGGPFIETTECQSYIDRWFEEYWEILEWLEEQYLRAMRYLMAWTMFGRPRPIPGIRSMLEDKVADAKREAGNSPIQGSAGDYLKLCMGDLTPVIEYFASFKTETCLPLLQVHDELVLECSRAIAHDVAGILRQIMRTMVELTVPVDSSADVAERWGMLK